MMKIIRLATPMAAATLAASAAYAQIPVIDAKNYAVAQQTAKTTDNILDTNREILKTVEETLQAVTGDRSSTSQSMTGLAVGQGFSVASMPDFMNMRGSDGGILGSISPEILGAVSTFINALKLVQNITGQTNSSHSGDLAYQQLVDTVTGVAALVQGTQKAVVSRRSQFEQAGQKIGQAEDIKGSIDQNTALQVETGLTVNEMIGVMNGLAQSVQTENKLELIEMSNTARAFRRAD